jgi:hypothetical protein
VSCPLYFRDPATLPVEGFVTTPDSAPYQAVVAQPLDLLAQSGLHEAGEVGPLATQLSNPRKFSSGSTGYQSLFPPNPLKAQQRT